MKGIATSMSSVRGLALMSRLEYFENKYGIVKYKEFLKLGKWSADNFIYRYFSLYVDTSGPFEFIDQYARLRDYLIGSGMMTTQVINKNQINVGIDYGQTIPKSIIPQLV